MTFGYSRDDVGKFLPIYLAQGILQNDPFEVSLIFMQVLGASLEDSLYLHYFSGIQLDWNIPFLSQKDMLP
jgi:hypothetical protein